MAENYATHQPSQLSCDFSLSVLQLFSFFSHVRRTPCRQRLQLPAGRLPTRASGRAGGGTSFAEAGAAGSRRGLQYPAFLCRRPRGRGAQTIIGMLAAVAAAERLPLLATGGVLHASRDQRIVSDVFTCLRHHTTLDAAGRLLAPNDNRRLHDARTMQTLFAD